MRGNDLVEIDFSISEAPFVIKNLIGSMPASYPHRDGLQFCLDWLKGVKEFDFQTSGSTGAAKLIRVSRERIEASVQTTATFLGLHKGDEAFVCLNTKFTGGKMMLARAMYLKMKVYLVPPQNDPFDLLPKNSRISIMPLVPSQINALLTRKDSEIILKQIKNILLGGAAVNEELRTQIKLIASGNVFETFGMTETLSHIALRKLNGHNAQSAFRLLEGLTMAKDERNCLLVKGPVTENQWIVTNDVVDILDTSHFMWKGRADNVINSGGVKIQLEELEELLYPLLKRMGYNGEFLLGGKADAFLGTRLVLFLEEKFIDDSSILQFLKQNLPLYHAPREIVYLESLPRTPSGKLKRII